MRAADVCAILTELTSLYLSHRYDPPSDDRRRGAERGLSGGSPRRSDALSVHKRHKGLLCADTYNLQAAMWRLRATEPQAALFLQVGLGRLPPGVFAELHKLSTSLSARLTGNKAAAAQAGPARTATSACTRPGGKPCTSKRASRCRGH